MDRETETDRWRRTERKRDGRRRRRRKKQTKKKNIRSRRYTRT